MATNFNNEEIEILTAAEEELFFNGKTSHPCPRCGSLLSLIKSGNSCVLKCGTEDCVEIKIRGI